MQASPEEAKRVKKWSVTLETLDTIALSDIMTEVEILFRNFEVRTDSFQVHDVMDLFDQKNKADSHRETFSENILRLEICGPPERD